MKQLIAEWEKAGKAIPATSLYLLAFVLTVFMDVTALWRALCGHDGSAVFYFLFAAISLLFFFYVSKKIRDGLSEQTHLPVLSYIIMFFVFCMTVLFFTDGGVSGGSFLFVLVGIAVTPLLLSTKESLLLVAVQALVLLCNIVLSLAYPGSVHTETYHASDLLLPLFLTVLFLAGLCLLYTVAYRRQEARLSAAAAEAKSAVEAKTVFLDNMSHEIRTPMNTILGMNEMILREEDRPEIREYAAQIQRSGMALLTIINDIIDFSKIQDNKMQITPIRYDLSSLINDMVNIGVDQAKRKSLDFQIFADRDVPRILYGDEFHIRQVILNILNNAVKYTDRGGVTLRVGFDKEDDENILLRISVEDTGIGIREEDMEKIFAPFEQAGEELQLHPEGTGLGLSIVRSLLSLMDSELEIHSVRGEGSTFSFAIRQPVIKWEALGDYTHAFREARAHEEEKQTFIAPDARILVVDDTPVNLVVFQNLLKDTQMQIDTAASGEEMLQMVRVRKYDLIFLDHRMPGMDGVQAFHTMQKMKNSPNGNTPVIALTANAVIGARQMYLDEGFRDYLAKPVDSLRLEQTVRTYLPENLIQNVTADEAETISLAAQDPSGKETAVQDEDAAFRTLEGIDYDAGVKNCGGADIFKEALAIFYETVDENADKIEAFAEEKDYCNYTVLVHALKSSARLVGALQLSADALHLEDAGNAEDEAEIAAKTPALLQDFRAYKDILKPVFGGEDDADKPEISAEELTALYDEIRTLADEFDLDALDEAVARADAYRMPDAEKDRFDRVKAAVRSADWGALEESLSGR